MLGWGKYNILTRQVSQKEIKRKKETCLWTSSCNTLTHTFEREMHSHARATVTETLSRAVSDNTFFTKKPAWVYECAHSIFMSVLSYFFIPPLICFLLFSKSHNFCNSCKSIFSRTLGPLSIFPTHIYDSWLIAQNSKVSSSKAEKLRLQNMNKNCRGKLR